MTKKIKPYKQKNNVIRLKDILIKKHNNIAKISNLTRLPDRENKNKFAYIFDIKQSKGKKLKYRRQSANNLLDFKNKIKKLIR